jgi:hypothetical protein
MTQQASDVAAYVDKAASRDVVTFMGQWAIGATGAVGASVTDDPRITLTRSGVGAYDLTFPAGYSAFIDFELQAVDATPTAMSFVLTAKSPTAGTASFIAGNTTAAIEIESGSVLTVCMRVASRAAWGG